MKKLTLLLSSFLMLFLPSQHAAGQSCNTTAANGAYGNINVLGGTAIDTTATFTITCTGTANQTVRLCIEFGTGGGSDRDLDGPSESLDHEIYTDAGRTVIWGSWGITGASYTPYPFGKQVDLALGPGGSNSTIQTVYGRISASQQTRNPGAYSWSTSRGPDFAYGYAGGSSCPTGGSTAGSGTATWTATIVSACNISATNVSFGSAANLSSLIDATGTATVQCTDSTAYNVGLDAGTGSGATVTTRKMTHSGLTINYSLYRNAARTQVWGTTIGTNTVSGTGSGSNQNVTVYGRVPVQTAPGAGTFTDTITATVTY